MGRQFQQPAALLSGGISIPTDLTTVFQHIDKLMDQIRSSRHTTQERMTALLNGAATSTVFACFVQDVYPSWISTSGIERSFDGFKRYLERLVMPDYLGDSRKLILQYLNVHSLDYLCKELLAWNARHPEIVTTLLELRIGQAKNEIADLQRQLRGRKDPELRMDGVETLLTEMAKIRVAYRLRCVAMKCEAQIHAPFAWAPLDDLERSGAGGCLRVCTLIRKLKHDLELVKTAVDLFSTPLSDPIPFLSMGLFTSSRSRFNRQAPKTRIPTIATLEPKARLQLAIWQAKHGRDLPNILDSLIQRISAWLIEFEKSLNTFQNTHPALSIVGNLNRANSGEQLYLAVREAVAWTKDDGVTDEFGNQNSAITLALNTKPSHSLVHQGFTIPTNAHDDAPVIDRLFVVYRIAILQDNDVLPRTLRKIKTGTGRDGSTRSTTVKTHDHAARIRGSRYTFLDQWTAWRRELAQKIAQKTQRPDVTKAQIAQARQIDLAMKRGAWAIIKGRNGPAPFGAYNRRDELRGTIVQGFYY